MIFRLSWEKSLLTVVSALLVAGWEIAIRPFLAPSFNLPLFLPYLVLLLISSSRGRGYLGVIVGATCLQLYVIGVQDLLWIRWILVYAVLDMIAHTLLTNRSFYVTIALGSLGYFLERLTSFLIGSLFWSLGISPYPWTFTEGSVTGFFWCMVIVGIGFLMLAVFTKRFSTRMDRTPFSRSRMI